MVPFQKTSIVVHRSIFKLISCNTADKTVFLNAEKIKNAYYIDIYGIPKHLYHNLIKFLDKTYITKDRQQK